MPILTPEQEAREQIDGMLQAAGWAVQARDQMRLRAARGVAVCEYPLTIGFADYLLFVDRRPIGVIEAKAVGQTLSGVEPQASAYCAKLPNGLVFCRDTVLAPTKHGMAPPTGRRLGVQAGVHRAGRPRPYRRPS